MTDSEMLDWLQQQDGYGLISDDFGRWVCTGNGMQNVPDDTSVASDIATSFFIEAADWQPTIRDALRAAIALMEEQGNQ